MSSFWKSPLIVVGTILVLLSAGGMGYHLLNKDSAPTATWEEPTKDAPNEDTNEPKEIFVYLTGEVKNPGVYKLKTESRLYEAIELAGGLTEKADSKAINLAKVLQDEDHFHLPAKGETTSYDYNPSLNPSGTTNQGKINLNTATQKELESLPGIGPTLASRIIEYRKANGFYQTIEDVKKVSGIGEKRFEAIKDLITVR